MQETADRQITNLNVIIDSLKTEKDKLESSHKTLQERYDDLSKRKENLVELIMAFRDCEVGEGLIKITRINPEDVFLRSRR